MKKSKKLSPLLILLISLSLVLSACSTAEKEQFSLRMALLPVLDTLPIHVAAQEGYFEQQGVT